MTRFRQFRQILTLSWRERGAYLIRARARAAHAIRRKRTQRHVIGLAIVLPLVLFDIGSSIRGTGGGGFAGGTVAGATTFSAAVTFSSTTLFSSTNVLTGLTTFGTAADAASSVMLNETANCITFEGTAADASEGRICGGNGGIDVTTSLPYLSATQTFAVLEGAQTFSGTKTINGTGLILAASNALFGGSAANTQDAVKWNTTLTPDGFQYATGAAIANSARFFEHADTAFDFNNCSAGTSAATDPLICVFSRNQNTAQYLDLSHNGTHGVINVGTGGLIAPAHLGSAGTAPAVSACGTTPSTVTGNDSYGRLTTGSGGTVQSCTLTFAVAYVAAPSCVANNETVIILLRATATTTTLVIDSAVAGTMESDVINYMCRGL